MLLDILADIPRVTAEVEQSDGPQNLTYARAQTLLLDIRSHASRLAAWRNMWETLHPGAAYEVEGGLDTSTMTSSPLSASLSTTIQLQSAIEGLEIITYNAALVYLMDLHEILTQAHGMDRDFESLTSHLASTTATRVDVSITLRASSPLLLPSQLQKIAQPALEALRVMPFLHKQLGMDDPGPITMVPLAPFAILFCVWKRMPELESSLPSLLRNMLWFKDSDMLCDFDLHKLWQRHVGREHMS
jgi:hypothetical protein